MSLAPQSLIVWAIVALSITGVIARPFRWPEAVWAVAGAAVLVVTGLLPAAEAWHGVAKGFDVTLFLLGMMALAEVARRDGLFDWLARHAVRRAGGSAAKLFALVYGVGIMVTVFLSNDATAVVLTPAVYAAAEAAEAEPLPYLYVCAMVANAASFVLPISNPANLVVYAAHMPPLAAWLARFAIPSLASIVVTFAVLRLTQRAALRDPIVTEIEAKTLSTGGKLAAAGLAATAIALLVSSALGLRLGVPTFVAGAATATLVLAIERKSPGGLVRNLSWSVIALVAGLFVLVEALATTGVPGLLAGVLKQAAMRSDMLAGALSGTVVAFGANLVNNLPAGLLAGAAVQGSQVSDKVAGAVAIGIDLGPNLSVTGSLATILWLAAIRREGEEVSPWRFLRLGALAMPPALAAALAALMLQP